MGEDQGGEAGQEGENVSYHGYKMTTRTPNMTIEVAMVTVCFIVRDPKDSIRASLSCKSCLETLFSPTKVLDFYRWVCLWCGCVCILCLIVCGLYRPVLKWTA